MKKTKKPFGRLIHPTAEEVSERFYKELRERIDKRIDELCPDGCGIIFRGKILNERGEEIRVEEKLNLMKEWENKGRKLAFLTGETWYELILKKYKVQFYYEKKDTII